MTTQVSSCPDHILASIAWYPDGLEANERGAVEAHAADCRACRDELAFLRGDEEPEIEVPDPDRVYQRVLARIDAHEGVSTQPRTADTTAPGSSEVAAGSSSRAGWLRTRPLAVAAGVAVAVLAGVLGGVASLVISEREISYQTASATPAVSAAGGPELDVMFRAEVTAERLHEGLRAVGAQVIAGPNRLGVFRVRLAPGADMAAVARALRGEGQGVAAFAEPATG